MTRVLVTFGSSPADAGRETVIALKIRYYVAKLKKYNLEPLFVWPDMAINLNSLYEWCDCVLLSGGGDIHAKWYNEEPHPKADLCYPGRDEMEFELLEKVFRDKKPVLGICRGMQAIAIAKGGTVLQHIPELNITEQHGESEHLHTVENMVRAKDTHDVLIEKDSRVFELVRKRKVMVNSFHHQMVEKVQDPLRIVGKSPKGVTEIIESTDPSHFCTGIQSHPERFEESDLENVFAKFAEEASKLGMGKD